MFRKILVSLTGFESDDAALDTAYLVGRLFNAHIHCICARPGPAQVAIGATPFEIGAAMNAAELIADLQKENELRAKNARLSFDRFCKRWDVSRTDVSADNCVSATWQNISGDEVEAYLLANKLVASNDRAADAPTNQPCAHEMPDPAPLNFKR